MDFWVGTMANSETPKLSQTVLLTMSSNWESPLSNALVYKKFYNELLERQLKRFPVTLTTFINVGSLEGG